MRLATEISPNDPRWWRMRAVLLWPSDFSSAVATPLDPSWESILEVAQGNDPGNALYPVLRATEYSRRAIEWDDEGQVQIGDADAWHGTIRATKQAASSSKLELGEPCINGLVRLHTLSNHPIATTTDSIRARFVATFAATKAALLARNLRWMAEAKGIATDLKHRRELLRLSVSISDLAFDRSDSAVRHSMMVEQIRRSIREGVLRFEAKHGGVTHVIESELNTVSDWENSLQRACLKFNQAAMPSQSSAWNIAGPTSLKLLAATLMPIIMLAGFWFAHGRSRPRTTIFVWPFLSVVIGTVVSLLFSGLGPAGVISERSQNWLLNGLVFTLLTSIIGGIAVRSRIRLRFSIRQLLCSCAVVAAVLQFVMQSGFDWTSFDIPIKLHASPNVIVHSLQQQPGAVEPWCPGPAWVTNVLFVWLIQDGPMYLVAGLIVCAFIRFLWSSVGDQIIAELLATTCILSLICLAVWVWGEPARYAISRPRQMQFESYIRSIDEYYRPLENLVKDELAN